MRRYSAGAVPRAAVWLKQAKSAARGVEISRQLKTRYAHAELAPAGGEYRRRWPRAFIKRNVSASRHRS